jgi:hypothetical protein
MVEVVEHVGVVVGGTAVLQMVEKDSVAAVVALVPAAVVAALFRKQYMYMQNHLVE